MTRIAVIGNVGAGKTTLARWLGRALDLRHCELDRLAWRRDVIAALERRRLSRRVFHIELQRQLEEVGYLPCGVEETACSAS